VSDAEVSSLLQVEATWEVIAQTLIEAAIEAGGSDNITVVLISQESGEDSSVS
jgi:serine/threonine protein phosphatase PrpC